MRAFAISRFVIFAAIGCVALLLQRAEATPGDLDESFGIGGKTVTSIGVGDDYAYGVAAQSDGKTVVVGYTNNGSNNDISVVRYHANGELDGSFGVAGVVTTAIGASDDYGLGVAVQSDGKIVVSGYFVNGSNTDICVLRYLADGSLDSSFGTGGLVTTGVGSSQDGAYRVVIQSDGKIVVGGFAFASGSYDMAVVRLNANGSLDSTFGTGGRVRTSMGAGDDWCYSLTVQSDGKIVLGGYSNSSGSTDFALLRYQTNGSLDSSFGTGGRVTTTIGSSTDVCYSVALQSDGKILAGGYAWNGTNYDLALVRYNANGGLDASFGTGGRVITDHGNWEQGRSVFVQNDGRILLAGSSITEGSYNFGLMRYRSDGSVDTSFGESGRVVTAIGSSTDLAYGLALQSDGKIVAAGPSISGGHYDFSVVRYQNALAPAAATLAATNVSSSRAKLHGLVNANENAGGGDTTVTFEVSSDGVNFTSVPATPGLVTGSAGTAVSASLAGLDLATTHQFRVRGTNAVGTTVGGLMTFATAAFPSDDAGLANLVLSMGTLAPVFATGQGNYMATVPSTVTSVTVTPTLAQPDATLSVNGSGVESGTASGAIALAIGGNVITVMVTAEDGITTRVYEVAVSRLPPVAGELDVTFNLTGIATKAIGTGDDHGYGVAVQSDGKVVVAGYSRTGNNQDFALARYLGDGSLDGGFGSGGLVTTAIGASNDIGRAVAIQGDGRIVVAGYSTMGNNDDLALARYLANGSLDSAFGNGGKVTTAIGTSNDHGYSVAIQPDGKILVGGSSRNGSNLDFALVRYRADGTLDTDFGSGGKVVTPLGISNEEGQSLALQRDGKILVAGYSSTGGNDDFAVVRYLTNGSLDASFGSGGKVVTAVGSGDDVGTSVAVQRDGKIVVGGYLDRDDNYDFAVVRYWADGSLDVDFGSGGRVMNPVGSSHDRAFGMVLQNDGKIVMAGASSNGSNNDVSVMRFHVDGSPDGGFGSGGKVITPIGSSFDEGYGVALQADGRLLVAGRYSNGSNSDFALVRYFSELGPEPEIVVKTSLSAVVGDGDGYTYGSVGVAGQRSHLFTISNTGPGDLKGLTLSIDGANAGMFSVVSQPAETVAQGGETTFNVRYAPTSQGDHAAVLYLANNDADESPFEIFLSGTGVAAKSISVKTLAATSVTFQSATLNGSVDPKNTDPVMMFEYGTTAAYGMTVAAMPGVVTGNVLRNVSAAVSGLQSHTKYFYRLKAVGSLGTSAGASLTFTTTNRNPVAVAESFAVLPGAILTLDVLANDLDPDGDALSLVSTSAVAASKGKVAKVNGKLVFTASSSFDGAAFDYVTKDNFGGTATGTVNLTLGTSTIDPGQMNVAAAGGSYTIHVTAAGAWSIQGAMPWTSIAPKSQVGDGVAQITVLPNAAKASRTATIYIAGKPHVISQAGVSPPEISMPVEIPRGMVGVDYLLMIPTINAPVKYSMSIMVGGYSGKVLPPPGLTLNADSGVLSGKPTAPGTFPMIITARNAAGVAPTILRFDIVVDPLPEGLAGNYQGYIPAHAGLNGLLGSRFEMTATAAGTVSGKVITGVIALPFTGSLDVDTVSPTRPQLAVSVARTGKSPLSLNLMLNAATGLLSGVLSSQEPSGAVEMEAWRQVWRAGSNPATMYQGLHTFSLTSVGGASNLPQGHGFGSFIVDENTGALRLSGKLADNSVFVTSTFVGPGGEVLVYQPLYGNLGSFAGVLGLASDHGVEGLPRWFKPAPVPASRDTIYRAGFGPTTLTASGGAYPVMPAGGVLMGLRNSAGNAFLDFSLGGLDDEGKEFDITFSLLNPNPNGLTNKATFPGANLNQVTMPTVNTATGAFAGGFTLAGATMTPSRKVSYQGQIVQDGNGIRGYGFFLLPEPAVPPLTLSTSPKGSGRVILGGVD